MSTQAKRPGSEEHGPEKSRLAHDDDAIVVPKGTSKLRFLFLLGLTIFILIIFTVGDELMQSFGRPSGSTDIASWDGPLIGKKVWTASEFTDAKRREDDFNRVVSLARGSNQRETKLDNESQVMELLYDELARSAGIEVPTKELTTALIEGVPGLSPAFQNREIYLLILNNAGVSPLAFENVLRRKLRARRYLDLVQAAMPVADLASIEAEWKRTHLQVAFDVIELEHATFDAEAKAAMPDEAGMRAWYDALTEKHSLFEADFLPETNAAELIAYRFGGENTAAALLERFPLAADQDAEQLAKDYYNQYSSVRFVRADPLPEGTPESEGKDRLLNSYEEVAEVARKESKVLSAFRAWVSDVKARKQAGETINLEAEATTFGLSWRASDSARTEAEWSALPDYGGPFVARAIAGTPKDDLGADVTVDRTGMSFPRVLEKNPTTPPPFEKIAEKARGEWVKQKTQELATAKLNLVRDAFPAPEADPANPAAKPAPKADEAAFKAAAEAKGLSVQRREWMSFAEQNVDPESTKPSHEFLRYSGFLRNMKADELSAVQPNRTRTHSFLVRSLGEREPLEVNITPGDLSMIQRSLRNKKAQEFMEANFTPAALAKRFNLRVRGGKEIPEPGT